MRTGPGVLIRTRCRAENHRWLLTLVHTSYGDLKTGRREQYQCCNCHRFMHVDTAVKPWPPPAV